MLHVWVLVDFSFLIMVILILLIMVVLGILIMVMLSVLIVVMLGILIMVMIPEHALHEPVESKTRTYLGRSGSARRTARRRDAAEPGRTGRT